MVDVGDSLGRFTVAEFVATGSSGSVFRGTDQATGGAVALKVWEMGDDALIVQRAQREMGAVRHLRHGNIVGVVDMVETDDLLVIAYAWVPGGSLEQRLATNSTLPLADVLRLGIDLTSALEHAHGRGMIHRDIKPSNVLIDERGTFLLTDFGAFGQLDRRTNTTVAGEISGTPLYMSPEQMSGDRQSRATDLYGLGLLLFRSLHGFLPGGSSSGEGIIEIVRTRSEAISVPASPIQHLLVRLLDPNPSLRPPDVSEVRRELEEVRARLDTALPPEPTETGIATSSGKRPRPPPPVSPPSRPDYALEAHAARARMPMLVVGAIGLAVVVIMGAALWQTSASRSTALTVAQVVIGLAIIGLSLVLARRVSEAEPEPTGRQATAILYGIEGRDALSESLMTSVDQIVARLRSLDSQVYGVTLLAMAKEYEQGKNSSDRQQALLNVAQLMEKLNDQLSPWHVRYKEQIALAVTVVGALTGIATAISAFVT